MVKENSVSFVDFANDSHCEHTLPTDNYISVDSPKTSQQINRSVNQIKKHCKQNLTGKCFEVLKRNLKKRIRNTK